MLYTFYHVQDDKKNCNRKIQLMKKQQFKNPHPEGNTFLDNVGWKIKTKFQFGHYLIISFF